MSAKLFGSAAFVNETTAAPREGLIDFSFSPLIARICRGDFPIRSYYGDRTNSGEYMSHKEKKNKIRLEQFLQKIH